MRLGSNRLLSRLNIFYQVLMCLDALFLHVLRQKPDKNLEVFSAPVFLEFIVFDHSELMNDNFVSRASISSKIVSQVFRPSFISRQ